MNTETTSNIQTLAAQSNIMPTRTSLVIYIPTSTVEGTKSLPSVQPSSTKRIQRITETVQPTPQSSRAPWPRRSTESSMPNAPTGSPAFITLDLKTIAIIAGAAAFLATICMVIGILAVIVICKCKKSRTKRHAVKRAESMLGNAAYGTTASQSHNTAIRTYRPGDTYDYPRFGLQLLKSVNKCRGAEVHNGAAGRVDNTYTSVTTFSAAQGNEGYVTSPTSIEDFEDDMQTNEAYVATPTSHTGDFEHSMQINEAYVATPTSANGDWEHSMQQRDDVRYVYR